MKTFRSLKYNTPKRLKLINLSNGVVEHPRIKDFFYARYSNTGRIIHLFITFIDKDGMEFIIEIPKKDLNYSGYYCLHNQFCLCITNEAVLEVMQELNKQAITLFNNTKYYIETANMFLK